MAMNSTCISDSEFIRSLETPQFVEYSLHVITIIATPIHITGFYVILRKTPKEMSTVKWNILVLHISTVVLDYSLSLLIVPYMIYPVLGGIPLGVLQWLEVPSAIQFYMATVELGLVAVAIRTIFEGRFYILYIESSGHWWEKVRIPWQGFQYLVALFIFLPVFMTMPDQAYALELTKKRLPCVSPSIYNHPDFMIFCVDILYGAIAASFCTTVVGFEIFLFVLIINWKSYQAVKTHRFSQRTINLQIRLLVALLIQVSVPLVNFLLPVIGVAFIVFGELYSQALNDFGTVVVCCHGITSTIVMILIHTPYRKALFIMLKIRREGDSVVVFARNESSVRNSEPSPIAPVGSVHVPR